MKKKTNNAKTNDEKEDNVVMPEELENMNNESNGDATEEENDDLNQKIAELNEKYLRVYSDFDNYRKRTIKEKNELSKFASAELITELLPVIDDFERALKSIPKDKNNEAIVQGIELIFQKFTRIMEQKGLKPILAVGEVFDTDFHEAVTKIPVEDEEQKGKVYDEVQKGYILYDKVIRYAKVIVAE